jgi:signal transduction protein with GAF and PtsI domain
MPPARRSTRSSSRRSATYKEPAALKQLNKSLDGVQKALSDLRKQTGRDAAKTTQALYDDLRKFVTNSRRDSRKFATALKRDFDQAQKALAKAQSSARTQTRRTTTRRSSASSSRRSGTSSRTSRARAGASRTTRKTS